MIEVVRKGEIISTYMLFERNYEVETGKTEVWSIYSLKNDTRLGSIKWFGRWRQYALFPEPESIFNSACLRDIENVIQMRMSAWRAKKLG